MRKQAKPCIKRLFQNTVTEKEWDS